MLLALLWVGFLFHGINWADPWIGKLRRPVARRIAPLTHPLRIAEVWGLYPYGPDGYRTMEILVDGELVYRSEDPEHRWRRRTWRYRRIRPIVQGHCRKIGPVSLVLVRRIGDAAREDFPGAQEVVVRCTWAPWDRPLDIQWERRHRVAESTDWRPELLR